MAVQKDSLLTFSNKQGQTNWVKVAIVAIAATFIIYVIYQLYKAYQSAKDAAGKLLADQAVAENLNIPVARVSYIRSLANELWDNGVTNYWAFYDYDEEMFITDINQMQNIKEVGLLDQFFKEKSGKRLKDVINASFSNSDKARVKADLLAYLLQ